MRKVNYDKYPHVAIKGYDKDVFAGYKQISEEILTKIDTKGIIVIDCYPAVRVDEIVNGLKAHITISEVIYSDDIAYDGDEITNIIKRNLTDDRVFGVISHHQMIEFFDPLKLEQARKKVASWSYGILLIVGVGASLISKKDVLIYADLARWEIQKRYRNAEFGNWKQHNEDEDFLRRYKRAYFIEWRVADRHKQELFKQIDYLLDTNTMDKPKMITAKAFFAGLDQTVKRPFRVVPFFDPGVWGGQWIKEVCDLPKDAKNYAWGFDCVPEENSLLLRYGEIEVEIPALNLVLLRAKKLLGDKVQARFGNEFPIRFDFLDTMKGQHLSLQVHPLTEHIQDKFGMHYTQDESYYMLDVDESACVYLGVKENINPQEMIADLQNAQNNASHFDDERYINKIPAKKHDHFLIPAGTVHSSGSGSMVLEISATPYIFTFKLWDWGRLGLDGLPRPVHIEHGKDVIQFDRDTKWVYENLVNQVQLISDENGIIEEKTGLHQRQFIETRRHWFDKTVIHHTNDSVNVLNLIEGEEAIVESVDGSFEPFIVHYAETFIIPENVKSYQISPYGLSLGKKIATIKAYVRT